MEVGIFSLATFVGKAGLA